MAPARLDEILTLLRDRGGRVTTARRALVTALLASDGHVTADDLAEDVQRLHPDVHRSTIYRTLADLEELGVVDHVHLGHGRAVYHLAGDVHHHLVCDHCGGVVEAPDKLFQSLARRLYAEFGFTMHHGHFAVTGRCAACAQPGAPPEA